MDVFVTVVICFQISIFDTIGNNSPFRIPRLVHVVICFQISIFDTIGNNLLIWKVCRKKL